MEKMQSPKPAFRYHHYNRLPMSLKPGKLLRMGNSE